MVVIRLARRGQKKRPFYHINVADQRAKRDGKFLEKLGYFNPLPQGQAQEIELNVERLSYWIANGAQMSDTVSQIVKKHSLLESGKPQADAPEVKAEVKSPEAQPE